MKKERKRLAHQSPVCCRNCASDAVDTSDIPEILPEQFAGAVVIRGLQPYAAKAQQVVVAQT